MIFLLTTYYSLHHSNLGWRICQPKASFVQVGQARLGKEHKLTKKASRFTLSLLLGSHGDPKRMECLGLRRSEEFRLEIAQRCRYSNVEAVGAIIVVGNIPVYGSFNVGLSLPQGHFTTIRGWSIDGQDFGFQAGRYPPAFERLGEVLVPTPITAFFFDPSTATDTIKPPELTSIQRRFFQEIPERLDLWLVRRGERIPQKPFIRSEHPSAAITVWVDVI